MMRSSNCFVQLWGQSWWMAVHWFLQLLLLLSSSVQESHAVPLNVNNGALVVANNGAKKPVTLANNASTSMASFIGHGNALIRSGCRYRGEYYPAGTKVPTDESCLSCKCKGSIVVCKLRICPEVPDAPPPGCVLVQKLNKCCAQVICYDNPSVRRREQRLSSGNSTLPAVHLADKAKKGGVCVHEGTVYAEGSAMRSSTLCEHCFCIGGRMKCSSPQCIIPLNGCKPRYRSYACCPTNYDCSASNSSPVRETTLRSTPVPGFLKGCRVGDRWVAEGEPVLPIQMASANILEPQAKGSCQTCFCMGGVVHCRPLQCAKAIEGCTPVIEEGHCCPDRYDCSSGGGVTTDLPPQSEEETEDDDNGDGNTTRQTDLALTARSVGTGRSHGGEYDSRSFHEPSLDDFDPVFDDVSSLEEATEVEEYVTELIEDSTTTESPETTTTASITTESALLETSTTPTTASRISHVSKNSQNLEQSTTISSNLNYMSSSATLSTVPTTELPTTGPSTGNLQFISFGMEDAVTVPSNDTRYEIYPGIESSKPSPSYNADAMKGSLLLPTSADVPSSYDKVKTVVLEPKPLRLLTEEKRPVTLVERDEKEGTEGSFSLNVPVQTSLYNNGFFGGATKSDRIGEVFPENFHPLHELPSSPDVDSIYFTSTMFPTDATIPTQSPALSRLKDMSTSVKRPEPPLKAISSDNDFIPSFVQYQPENPPENSQRTYSKFGIQDSSFNSYYKYQFGSSNNLSSSQYSPAQSSSSEEDSSPEETTKPQIQVPMISSSGSMVSVNARKHKPERKRKIVNSKPLRRKENHPLGFKPVVAFPFQLSHNSNSKLPGLKLSGCNIYGKMYGVGRVIRELSSPCVQCRCSEIGVNCVETPC